MVFAEKTTLQCHSTKMGARERVRRACDIVLIEKAKQLLIGGRVYCGNPRVLGLSSAAETIDYTIQACAYRCPGSSMLN